LGSLTAQSYILTNKAGTLTLTDASNGANVAFTGNGTAGNPIVANGVSIVLSGAPAVGDQFLIQPTNAAASGIQAVLTDPSKIAAAGAIRTTAANANTGSGTISSGTVLDATNPNLLTAATITFTGATTVSAGVLNIQNDTGLGTTAAGTVVGSVQYMAPEQMMGERVDGKADVFSLAAVAYELLTGRHPYRRAESTPEELARDVCQAEPVRPSAAARRAWSFPGIVRST